MLSNHQQKIKHYKIHDNLPEHKYNWKFIISNPRNEKVDNEDDEVAQVRGQMGEVVVTSGRVVVAVVEFVPEYEAGETEGKIGNIQIPILRKTKQQYQPKYSRQRINNCNYFNTIFKRITT